MGKERKMAVPVRDLNDTAEFCQTVRESEGPLVVTRNGHEEFFLLTSESFRDHDIAYRRQEIHEAVDAAEARLAAGEGLPARTVLAQIRKRHGL